MKTLFKVKSQLCLLFALLIPASGFAANYCIATNGGFGAPNFGQTFIEPSYALPAKGKCNLWAGFTKTGTTVVLTTSGTGCLSTDGTALTVSVSSADPEFLGAPDVIGSDYITFVRSTATEPFTTGSDQGNFSGAAEVVTCTSSLLKLPASHD